MPEQASVQADTNVSYEGETSTRVLKFAIALVFHAWDCVRVQLRRIAGYSTAPPVVVLMYHSVKRDERERFARQIDQLVRLAHPVYADFNGAATGDRRHVVVTFDDGYHSVLENAFPILSERGVPGTFFVPTRHIGNKPGWITDERHRDASERLLTAEELRYMRSHGALIGSHGVTHRPLTKISPGEIAAELSESRKTLSEMLGTDVTLFALPYGAGNADVYRAAVSAGYARVFLNVPVQHGDASHVVGRIEVSPTDWPLEFRLKIRGAYQWLPLAMSAKRKVVSLLKRRSARKTRRAVHTSVQRTPKSVIN
jgi:peptidoglycan/xylan/chitin deacetylase (PgdA/CDA1 family)